MQRPEEWENTYHVADAASLKHKDFGYLLFLQPLQREGR